MLLLSFRSSSFLITKTLSFHVILIMLRIKSRIVVSENSDITSTTDIEVVKQPLIYVILHINCRCQKKNV